MTVNSIRKVKKYIITFCITYLLLLKLPLYICQSRQGESIKGIKQDKNTSVKFESESLLIMKFMLEPFLFRLLNNISLWNEVVFKKTYMQIKKPLTTSGLELHAGKWGCALHCPWSWPWCPSKVSHWNSFPSYGGTICKMKTALPISTCSKMKFLRLKTQKMEVQEHCL